MRATWKGHLRVSMMTLPVRVYAAVESSASVKFNQLHGTCGSKLKRKQWCEECDREVGKDEVVKGYEHAKSSFTVIDSEDIAKARPESARIIDVTRFVPVSELDLMHIERPYYLAPDGDVAAQSFATFRAALEADGKAGIGKVAVLGREYLVAVVPRGKGLAMLTMRSAAEVRDVEQVSELDALPDVNDIEVQLTRKLIGMLEGPLDLADFTDAYQAELRRIVDAKVAGEAVTETPAEPAPKVAPLVDALRRSLAVA